MTMQTDTVAVEQALEEACSLIQEAKGIAGPGSVTDHLDFAESWLDKILPALAAIGAKNAQNGGLDGATVEHILLKLHNELPYPTEVCALVRVAAQEANAAMGPDLWQDPDGLPEDVRRLVIAAREAWELGDSMDPEMVELDSALEAFSERVAYEDEPALRALPIAAGEMLEEFTADEIRHAARQSINAPGCGHNVFARSHGINSGRLSEFLSGKRGAEPSIIEPLGYRWALVSANTYPRAEDHPLRSTAEAGEATLSTVNAGNIMWRGEEWVPIEAYREAMDGWKAANASTPPADLAECREVLAKLLAFVLACSAENPAHVGSYRNKAVDLLESIGIEPRETGLFYHDRDAELADAAALIAKLGAK